MACTDRCEAIPVECVLNCAADDTACISQCFRENTECLNGQSLISGTSDCPCEINCLDGCDGCDNPVCDCQVSFIWFQFMRTQKNVF